MMLQGGRLGHVQLLSPRTLAYALRNYTDERIDEIMDRLLEIAGQARALRDRVRTYLAAHGGSPKTDALLAEVARLDVVLTDSVAEALGNDDPLGLAAPEALTFDDLKSVL